MPYLKLMQRIFIINVVMLMFLIGLMIGLTLARAGSENKEIMTQNQSFAITQPQIQFQKIDQALKPIQEKHKNMPIYAPTEPTFEIMDLFVSTSLDASSESYSYSFLTKDHNPQLVFKGSHKASEYEACKWLYENFNYLDSKKEMVELGNGLTGGFSGNQQKGTLEWHVGFWTIQITGPKEKAVEEGRKLVAYFLSHELLPTEGVISIDLVKGGKALAKWMTHNRIYEMNQAHYSGKSLVEALCSLRLYPDLRVSP